MVPLSLTMTSVIPSSPQAYQFKAHGGSIPLISGCWQTLADLEHVTESVSVTATHVPETLLTAPSSQGFVTFGTLSPAATSAIGSLPSGQSVSMPLGSGPSLTLHLSIPTDRPPNVQY